MATRLTIWKGILWAVGLSIVCGGVSAGRRVQAGQQARDGAERQISKFFDRLSQAIHDESDQPSIPASTLVDASHALTEIERQGLLGALAPSDRTSLEAALQLTLGPGLIREGRSGKWHRFEVGRIEHGDNDHEATARVNIAHKDGSSAGVFRFWLAERGGDWRAYDWSSVDALFRTSTNVAFSIGGMRADSRSRQIQVILAASRLANQGDYESAERAASSLFGTELPPPLEGAMWLVLAHAQFGHGHAKESLRSLDFAAPFFGDSPGVLQIRATAQLQLGNAEAAADIARESLEKFGDNPQTYAMLGDALARTDHAADAAAAYRNGLKRDPNSLRNLIGLGRVLAADKKAELVAYFGKLEDPAARFQELAREFAAAQDAPALEAIIAAYDRTGPNPGIIEEYRVQSLIIRKQFDSAARTIDSLAADGDDGARKKRLANKLTDALFAAGRPVDAYAQSAQPDQTFGDLAEQLLRGKDAENLAKLIDAHRVKRPDDLRLFFYAGQLQLLSGQREAADRAFAEGMAKAQTEDVRDVFRKLCVETRFDMGRGFSAYQAIGPRKPTFDQLTRLFAEHKQADQLLALVAAHRMTDPDDPSLDRWEGEARLLRQDYEAAAALLTAAIPRLASDELDRDALEERALDTWLLAHKTLEGYRRAPNAALAFRHLARRLLDQKDAPDLAKLVHAHQKKQPDDPQLDYFAGQARMLVGQYEAADKFFAAGLAKASDDTTREQFRRERIIAWFEMGKTLDAYEEIGPKHDTFDQLARLCADKKQAEALDALVAAHLKNEPDDSAIGLWEAEVKWIEQDYGAVIDVLNARRDAILSDEANSDRFSDRLIRSMVRLKRFDEALKQARASTSRDGDPWFEAVVYGAAGNVARTAAVLDRCASRGYLAEEFYADPDLGPALRSNEFKRLQATYPPPRADK